MLVRSQSILPVARQQGVDAAGRLPDLIELPGQLLVMLDVVLGLRSGDRDVLDCGEDSGGGPASPGAARRTAR